MSKHGLELIILLHSYNTYIG